MPINYIIKANLLENLSTEPQQDGPDAFVGLNDVLYDSLCLHPHFESLSHCIVAGHHSHYTIMFVQAQLNTIYCF